MSFVDDQFTAINGHLDRVEAGAIQPLLSGDIQISSRASKLQALVKVLNSIPLISRASTSALTSVLRQADFSEQTAASAEPSNLEEELEWLLLSKVALASHGVVLDTFLNWTIPVNDDIWYWNGVLNSYAYTGLYSVQTAPIRFYGLVKDAYAEARTVELQVSSQWNRFYDLVQQVAQNISTAKLRKHITSPLVILRSEIRLKREHLERIRSDHASAIGLLMTKSFNQARIEKDVDASIDIKRLKDRHKLKYTVNDSTKVLTAILKSAISETDDASFGSNVAEFLDRESDKFIKIAMTPIDLSNRLYEILQNELPAFNQLCALQLRENGRPPRIVRYWLPVSLLTIFSSSILRILLNRQASIQQWIREFGDTVIAFWSNWVVEPTRKLIGTIRHDSTSEISIMSKRSLEGDRASLERMVVDFAIANPDGPALQEADVANLRARVAEGDLTPVLKAYEKDLQSPFMGTIRGNLIRALLIQVQKTKVDVEVAMGGIDSLLKSQELVFGFVGLTPGILVCIAASRYLSGIFSNRRGSQRGVQQSRAMGILRNMDRILTMAPQSKDSKLTYKEHGLLVCEALALRKLAKKLLAKQRYRELVTDIDDLINIDLGVERQTRIVDRIRWAYTAWL